jgi:tetratricopeptide (TPR) repeat protein
MSLLGKLFGRRSAAEEKARADALFERGEHGLAKLAYDRAHDACEPADKALAEQCAARVVECCDAIARVRIAEAERLLSQGAHELALAELEHAAQTARSAALLAEIDQRMEQSVRSEARAEASAQPELGDDERFELIAGSFEAEQHDEYAAAGEPVRRALLALHGADAKGALPLLEAAVQGATSARYLWLELGRARLLCGDDAGGRDALERFLRALEPGEGGDARLGAHLELAGLAHDAGDTEGAIAQHEAALDALPDDPRPYLALARYLRRVELPDEALEVLDSALGAIESNEPPIAILIEQGLAHADLGAQEVAIETLEQAVSHLTTRRQLDLPPELATKLAELHEARGNKARALDLFALLTQGSDRANRLAYLAHAARLLLALDRPGEARRALQKVVELAPEGSEARTAAEAQLASLR